MYKEPDWAGDGFNLCECDTLSIRKLVSALFTEALTEAALLVEWGDHISSAKATSQQLQVTAASFLEIHENLSSFARCQSGTELLDWLQGFTSQVESEEYWGKLEEYLDESRYAIPAALKISPPHEKRPKG